MSDQEQKIPEVEQEQSQQLNDKEDPENIESSSSEAKDENKISQQQKEEVKDQPDAQEVERDEQLQKAQEKQNYLVQHIIEPGYDASLFATYLSTKKANGTDINVWSIQDLKVCVEEFIHQQEGTEMPQEDYNRQVTIDTQEDVDDFDDNNQNNWQDQLDQQQPIEESKQEINMIDNQQENLSPPEMFSKTSSYEVVDHLEEEKEPIKEPVVETRQTAKTKLMTATQLNYKKVSITVSDGEVKHAGMFASNYVIYQIKTKGLSWKATRKDSEFYTLRKVLCKEFPHVLIPPLPNKSGKQTKKVIQKREKYFSRFMNAVCRSEELKSSAFFAEFCKQNMDAKEWSKLIKNHEKIKQSKAIETIITQSGMVNVQMNQNSSVFCSKMEDFINSYQILYQEIIDCTRDLNERSQELSKTMLQLARSVEQLSELNKMIKVDSQYELLAWLSRMTTSTAHYTSNQGNLIRNYMGSYMKYHLAEHESFRELQQIRETAKQRFVKKERSLADKKDKLFKSKDVTKWGHPNIAELQKRSEELLSNQQKAQKFMLPNDTKAVDLVREELSYYTNQCFQEVRRVGHDNGILLNDHFIEFGQHMCVQINEHHVMWADFLSHFSSTDEVLNQFAQNSEQNSNQQSQLLQLQDPYKQKIDSND